MCSHLLQCLQWRDQPWLSLLTSGLTYLVNGLGPEPVTIKRGERIAQMVVQRVYQADIKVVSQLDDTERGDGGFGHTGR